MDTGDISRLKELNCALIAMEIETYSTGFSDFKIIPQALARRQKDITNRVNLVLFGNLEQQAEFFLQIEKNHTERN